MFYSKIDKKIVIILILLFQVRLFATDINAELFKAETRLANALQDDNHMNEAVFRYQKMLKKNNSPFIIIDLAQLYQKIGESQKALDILNSSNVEDKNSIRTVFALAKIYFDLADYKNSALNLKKIPETQWKKEEFKMAALIYNRLDRIDEAIYYYTQLIKKFDETAYYINLATLQEKRELINEAQVSFENFYNYDKTPYSLRFLTRFYKKYNKDSELQNLLKNIEQKKEDKKTMRPLLKSRN
ncbi:hypothetical protein JXR93_10390 [bacterium]|nr:hypothetical protein [bacterium]